MVMQDLIQACGRGTRAADDRCEVFITDDNIGWFLWRNKSLAPNWFEVRTVREIPPPGKRCPERLIETNGAVSVF
jgi:Rad3-related DNA helicase